MRFSQMFLPTLKETPSDAEIVSHTYMLRAGMIRKLASGIYSLLPTGLRALRRVEQIIREEMNRIGAQEVFLPSIQPAELWIESGRWDLMGEELLRFKDRHGRDFCYGPTHEEVITDLIRREVRSYRELPLVLYQIQTKFRDEIRPRYGLMRGREFGMKDAYSFDLDESGAEKTYWRMYDAYKRIFQRMNLAFRAVEADTGNIGGSFSHEFMVLAESGEDAIQYCPHCEYAANVEKAGIYFEECTPHSVSVTTSKPMHEVFTRNKRTVEEVTGFLNVGPEKLIKTLLYRTDRGDVAVLVRGDHEANEHKIKKVLDCQELRLAYNDEVEQIVGVQAGFVGPVGMTLRTLADQAIAHMGDAVVGANRADYHLMHVCPGRDFVVDTYADLRVAGAGDRCPTCGTVMERQRGIEVGHIFMLGTKYSSSFRATYLDREGKEQVIWMGCYGIGVGRTLAASVEQSHDSDGIIFPFPIAPFSVIITPVNVQDAEIVRVSNNLYDELVRRAIEVVLDDRDERPGKKFKDADLIGIPLRITIGPKGLGQGKVDVKLRNEKQPKAVPVGEVVEVVEDIVKQHGAWRP